jgi:NADH:ubiquinone oxidoreductase subunit 2 (subunit N)
MFIYNVSLFTLFFTLFQLTSLETKTLFSFADLGSSKLFTKILSLTMLSMAGVPPLWGFFTKVLIFVMLVNSNFSFLFVPFFTVLLVSLYFYMQNLRFLNSANMTDSVTISDLQLRVTPFYFSFVFSSLLFIIFRFSFFWLVYFFRFRISIN